MWIARNGSAFPKSGKQFNRRYLQFMHGITLRCEPPHRRVMPCMNCRYLRLNCFPDFGKADPFRAIHIGYPADAVSRNRSHLWDRKVSKKGYPAARTTAMLRWHGATGAPTRMVG